MLTGVGPKNHVLDGDGVQIIPYERAIFSEVKKRAAHCKVGLYSAVSCATTAYAIEMPLGMWIWVGLWNQVLRWGSRSPHLKGQF